MVFFLLLIHYLLVYDPSLDPFRPLDDSLKLAEHPNPVDVLVLGTLRKFRLLRWGVANNRYKGGKLENTFNKVGWALNSVGRAFYSTQLLH